MELTDYLAVYAAVLSSVVFAWNFERSRAKIKVELQEGLNEDQYGVFIFLKNPSAQMVHVNTVSLLYRYRETSTWDKIVFMVKYRRLAKYINWVHNSLVFHEIETGLPVSIEPRQSHSIFVPEGAIKEMLGDDGFPEIAAVAQDPLFRNKYSPVMSDPPGHRDPQN